ncbi:hypothetical protein GCM10009678_40260 [Actinomadura kijaniata]
MNVAGQMIPGVQFAVRMPALAQEHGTTSQSRESRCGRGAAAGALDPPKPSSTARYQRSTRQVHKF